VHPLLSYAYALRLILAFKLGLLLFRLVGFHSLSVLSLRKLAASTLCKDVAIDMLGEAEGILLRSLRERLDSPSQAACASQVVW
jgi:hypothetical protein